jgi:4-amino-4-deoxy-L-arabinose transferase-like glycosyltransferase
MAAAAWTLALIVSGGIDTSIAGLRITSHDFRRTLLYGAMLFAAYILTGGDVQIVVRRFVWLAHTIGAAVPPLQRLWNWIRRVEDRVFAVLLALCVLFVLSNWRIVNVGGSDPYGYLSQADLWLSGQLDVPQPWITQMPFPEADWVFTPLGYRPRADLSIVPTYSPGLPMIMAATKFVAGHCAVFFISPVSGALLVLATYGIGRRLGSSKVGLIAAWFVATSPTLLDMGIIPMSDVPVAALWAGAFFLLLGRSAWSALGAGLLTALAVLVRTNLAPLTGVCWLWLAYGAWRAAGDVRLTRLKQLAAYTLGVLPGPIVVAALNAFWYGSPFRSGYGPLANLYELGRVPQNVRNYTAWLVETQTVLVFAGVAALFLPIRRLWFYLEPFSLPRSAKPTSITAQSTEFQQLARNGKVRTALDDRSIVVAFAVFSFGVWFQYLMWEVFETSAYLRFLLPCYPFMMIGLATVVYWLLSLRQRVLTVAIVIVVAGFGLRARQFVEAGGFLTIGKSDTKYEMAGRLVAQTTPVNSVVMTMQHSGSIRYYGGRLTMRYDQLDDKWLDRAVEWFSSRNVRTFAFIEDWEVPEFRKRFPQQRLGKLDMKPIVTYRNESAVMYLYDLNRPEDETEVQTVVETFEGPLCLKPAPRVRVPFK